MAGSSRSKRAAYERYHVRYGRHVKNVPLSDLAYARVIDLIPIPFWVFLPIRLVMWIVFKQWYLAAVAASIYWLEPIHTVLIVLSLPMIFLGWIWVNNRHHGPIAVLRAGRHLVRARLSWRHACDAAELTDGRHRPRLTSLRRPVKIANDTGTALQFTLNFKRVGLSVLELEENKDYVASAMGARRTRLHRLTPGVAKLTIEWDGAVSRGITSSAANSSNPNATQLPRIELDQGVQLELDTSVLVVGESGSGKSNLSWYIVNGLNANKVNYRLYVSDPKKVELAELVDSPHTVVYSDSPKTIDVVFDRFYDDLMATFERMKYANVRKIELNDKNPLNILLLDELLLSHTAREGIDGPLGDILVSGRAAGFIVIGNSQLGQVDALSRIRDLFPQRVCMAVKSSDLTNAVLGPRAEERGARCTDITEKGVGYIYTDFSGSFQMFRPPFIDDVSTKIIAGGGVWKPPIPKRFNWWKRGH